MITQSLPDKKPYSIEDVNPLLKNLNALADGSRKLVSPLLHSKSSLVDVLEKMVWNTKIGIFGSVVHSIKFHVNFMLTFFQHVIGVYKKLETDRNSWLSTIPNAWKKDTALALLPKLRSLLIKSPEWKKVVKDIRENIMPLWPAFQTCCTNSTLSSYKQLPNPIPSTPISASTSLSTSHPPLSVQPTITDNTTLQIKTELLQNSNLFILHPYLTSVTI